MFTKEELLDLLLTARNLLHKGECGEQFTDLDRVLAHDNIDIAIDAIIMRKIDIDSY